ncbi:coiled-coil domain-containing protein 38 isoform X3 [Canis lupus baileyi]|uniref:coiled-coil domain-containing protein 38 isoform X3 n=1 Tax=Canis lupus dingo TaxID=286419 RepID=UPI000DC6C143|nr:coiled-coil domain-containing protein 38 isoform X3 [Canis lupus dingo]XP_038307712.1 coiled-coil domain-containing protein 38 isoform X1 [Canis lupus familiaris]XP_038414624.1 coiled-coil domain-containing protein 38 isoform X1 [Canis lupus familiaris]XP_038544211.1 coiled-coil domain-containing protein 38 isoform X1 [Canis lupus familiaris]
MSSQFFPISLASEDKGKDDSVKKDRPYKIFFKDLFLFKENEMAAKKKEKFINRSMKVYQKSTFSSRMKSRSHLGQVAFYSDATGGSFEKFGLDPTLILRLTEGADTKRTLHEFINDQRDRFLLEYALSTKRNTIKKFENHMAVKEQQLIKAEKKLQEDAMAFEEFLRENDQRSVDALKMAAQETINKLQMTTELKKASMEVQAVKSEIAKAEFLLREYMKYGFFLLKLSPKHWQIQQALKRVQMTTSRDSMNVSLPVLAKLNRRKTESNIEESRKISFSDDYYMERGSQGKPRKKTTLTLENRKSSLSTHTDSISSEDSLELFLDEDMDYDLEPELYFKEPEELLQVLTELEEQNLTLVQYSQDVDENLEDVNKREKLIQDKINSNIEFLLEHKEMLKASCVREEEKAAELELRSKLFSFGEFKSDAQKQEWGQAATWRTIYFAHQFIEILLTANAGYTVEKEPESYMVPKHITYKLEHIYQQLRRRSGQEKLIDSLSKKINQVYKVCTGDADVGSLNPVQKLVKVESRLVELSDLIESIPKENVEAIERIKQKERRQKLREEKMKEKQKHQEERLKAALERAVAQPKKKLGRQLVYRSKPPSGNKHELLLVKDTRTKSLEEEYFFT